MHGECWHDAMFSNKLFNVGPNPDMTFIFKGPFQAFTQMNKEVGALPSSTWPKKKVTFILVPVLWYPPASPQLPSLEFLQVSRFVCYVFWAEVPLCVPCSGFLFAICFSSSYWTDTASGMFLCRQWPLWECHCGSKGTCSCAHDAALYHQGLAQHHL